MIFSSVTDLSVKVPLLLLVSGTFLRVRADDDGEWFASSIYKPAKSGKDDSGGLNSWLSGADYDSAANEPAAPAVETYHYPQQLRNIFGEQQNNQQYAGKRVQSYSQGGQQYKQQQQQQPQQQQFQPGQQNPYQNAQQQNAYGGQQQQSQQGHPHSQGNQQHQQMGAIQQRPPQQVNPHQQQGLAGQQQQQGQPHHLGPGSPQNPQPNGQMNQPQPPSQQVVEEPAWKKNDDTNPWLFEQPKEPVTWSPEDEKFRQHAFSKMRTKWDYHDEEAEKQRKLQNTQGQVVYEKAYLTRDELMNRGNRIRNGAVINTGGNGQQFFNPEQQQANYQPQGDPMFQPVPKDFYKGKITENP